MNYLLRSPNITQYKPPKKDELLLFIIYCLVIFFVMWSHVYSEYTPENAILYTAKQAKKYKIDCKIPLSIIVLESDFQNGIIHPGGYALGVMGIKEICYNHYIQYNTPICSYPEIRTNWRQNIDIGIWYIKYCMKRKGNVREALTAYRFGPWATNTNYKYADRALEIIRCLTEN